MKKGSFCSKSADDELTKIFRERHNALGRFLGKIKAMTEIDM